MLNPRDWVLDAKCRNLGNATSEQRRDLLFPAARSAKDIAAAKRFCRDCPVIKQCLADDVDDAHSVRGGLTADERRRFHAGHPVRSCGRCRLPFVPRPANPRECTGCIGRFQHDIGPEDYKDAIIAMHEQGCSGEQICMHFGFSADEIRLAGKRWQVPLMRRPVADCGTPAGAARHRRRREQVCRRCQDADSQRITARKRSMATAAA